MFPSISTTERRPLMRGMKPSRPVWVLFFLAMCLSCRFSEASLESRLLADDQKIRQEALDRLGRLNPEATTRMTPDLIRCLGEGEPIAIRAKDALVRVSSISVPMIAEFLMRPETVPNIKDLHAARIGAMTVLDECGGRITPQALDVLISLIAHEELGSRACQALTHIERSVVSPALEKFLRSPPPGTDGKTIDDVVKLLIGMNAVSELARLLQSPPPAASEQTVASIVEALIKSFPDKVAVSAVSSFFTSPPSTMEPKSFCDVVRALAGYSYGTGYDAKVALVLSDFIQSPPPEIESDLILSVILRGQQTLRPEAIIVALVRFLQSPPPGADAEAIQRAIESLYSLGPDAAPAASALVALLSYPNRDIRERASSALHHIRAPAIPALLTGLKSEDFRIRQGASRVLWQMKVTTPEVRSALMAALNDENSVVRNNAYHSLFGQGSDPEIKPLLDKYLKDRAKWEAELKAKRDRERARIRTKEEIIAPIPIEDTDKVLKLEWAVTVNLSNGGELFVTVHSEKPPDPLKAIASMYLKQEERYRWVAECDFGEGFCVEEPQVLWYQVPGGDREHFLCLHTIQSGTGAFEDDILYHIDPEGSLQHVELVPASKSYEDQLREGEIIQIAHNRFTSDSLSFTLVISGKDDWYKQPTAGTVTGTYRFEITDKPGSPRTYRIVMDSCERGPGPKW